MRRYRSTLIVIGCTTALVGFATAAGLASMSPVFARLEQSEAIRNADRAAAALDMHIAALGENTQGWTDHNHVLGYGRPGPSQEPTADATPDISGGSDADVVILAELDGTILDSYANRHAGVGENVSLPAEFVALASRPDAAWASSGAAVAFDGLLGTEYGLYMVSVRPVSLGAEGTGADAVMIAGRQLDDGELARVSEQVDVQVTIRSGVASTTSANALLGSIINTTTVVSIIDENSLQTTDTLTDIYGTPIATLVTTQDRTIHAESLNALRIFPIAVVCLGIIAALICAAIARRLERTAAERSRSDAALRRSERRYRSLIDHLADPVLGFDSSDTVVYANTQASVLTGYDHSQLIGLHLSDLVAPVSLAAATRMHAFGDETHTNEITIARADGETLLVEVAAAPLAAGVAGDDGTQWIARDITERKRFEEELVHLATRDPLTGLFNRRRFEDELSERLAQAQRTDEPGTILWLDLDSFKEVNDTLGHRAGDELLVQITRLIADEVRTGSIMARLGGDEFAILFPRARTHEAAVAATRIMNRLRTSRFAIADRMLTATASIGIVQYPDHGTTPEELLSRADLAMYRAKDAGRNRYCVFEPTEEWSDELAAHFDWGLEIANALCDERFTAHAQPIIDVATNKIDRYELLIRMIDSKGDLVMPGVFLPVAERSGTIVDIDRWMVRHAISLLALAEDDIRVDVNLSGHSFGNLEILDIVRDELDMAGIAPSRLGFEITETSAVIDIAKARAFVEGVKRLGCRVALDDFGSGFSSFYYLRNIPIDCLKIDGTFIRNLADNPADQHVVRAIVELAAGFGIETTAEFVENAKVLDLLRVFGVQYAQGYYIGRPSAGTCGQAMVTAALDA